MIKALLLFQGALAILIDPSVNCFVSNFAGQGSTGSVDGVGTNARFFYPRGIAVDPSGTAYVADRSNNRIRGILLNRTVFTLGGNGTGMFFDGGRSESAFYNPIGIAASDTTVYTADFANNRLRATSATTLVTSTLVGTGAAASVDGVGAVSAATRQPVGAALSRNGTQLFFTDNSNGVRVVDVGSGRVSTLSRGLSLGSGGGACAGGIAQLSNQSVLVADTANHRIALLLGNGSLATFAGVLGVPGHGDGPRENVTFNQPTDIKVDWDGTLLVVDSGNHALRRLRADGSAVTLAGGNPPAPFVDLAFGGAATFSSPCGVAAAGAAGVYLITDTGNHRVRLVQCSARTEYNVSTIAGGGASGLTAGSSDGTGTAALFRDPAAIALSAPYEDAALVADMSNSRLRRVSSKCRVVTTLAGGGASGVAVGSANGVGSAALFYAPRGLALGSGGYFVSDTTNNRVRFVSPLGVVSLAAGNGSAGRRDGAVASGATTLSSPRGLAYDAVADALFIADLGNNKVRALALGANATLGTLAGGGPSGADFGTADGTGTSALFNTPVALTLWRGGAAAAPAGLLYVLEYNAHRIRVVDLATLATWVRAGGGGTGALTGFSDSLGTSGLFRFPSGLALLPQGGIVVADTGNFCVRLVTPLGVVTTLAGNGTPFSSEGVGTAGARFTQPVGVAVSRRGEVLVADSGAGSRLAILTPLAPFSDAASPAALAGQPCADTSYTLPPLTASGATRAWNYGQWWVYEGPPECWGAVDVRATYTKTSAGAASFSAVTNLFTNSGAQYQLSRAPSLSFPATPVPSNVTVAWSDLPGGYSLWSTCGPAQTYLDVSFAGTFSVSIEITVTFRAPPPSPSPTPVLSATPLASPSLQQASSPITPSATHGGTSASTLSASQSASAPPSASPAVTTSRSVSGSPSVSPFTAAGGGSISAAPSPSPARTASPSFAPTPTVLPPVPTASTAPSAGPTSTAAGVATFSGGSPTAASSATGCASAALAATGCATGSATGVPSLTGTASATGSSTGAPTATLTPHVPASAPDAPTGSATRSREANMGTAPDSGTPTGSASATGSSTGVGMGSATGALSFTGSASAAGSAMSAPSGAPAIPSPPFATDITSATVSATGAQSPTGSASATGSARGGAPLPKGSSSALGSAWEAPLGAPTITASGPPPATGAAFASGPSTTASASVSAPAFATASGSGSSFSLGLGSRISTSPASATSSAPPTTATAFQTPAESQAPSVSPTASVNPSGAPTPIASTGVSPTATPYTNLSATPMPLPMSTGTASATPSTTNSGSATVSASPTSSLTRGASASITPSVSDSAMASSTPMPSNTPTPTASLSAGASPSVTPTTSGSPSPTPSATPCGTPGGAPTRTSSLSAGAPPFFTLAPGTPPPQTPSPAWEGGASAVAGRGGGAAATTMIDMLTGGGGAVLLCVCTLGAMWWRWRHLRAGVRVALVAQPRGGGGTRAGGGGARSPKGRGSGIKTTSNPLRSSRR